jgi:ABC-2 type transport system permease protein
LKSEQDNHEIKLMKKKEKNRNPMLKLLFSIVFILIFAYLLSSYYYRFDLTSEKRYTLSDFSKTSLRKLSDIVYVKVYLDGDLNIPFRKMKQSIMEILDEFKVYAGDNLEYDFVNPFDNEDSRVNNKVVRELYEKGLKPTNILAKDKEGGSTEKMVFPGALIKYRDIEVPVNLLKNNPGLGPEENINNSLQALEFEFIRVISSLSSDTTEKLAFIEGHGELNEYQVRDITNELGWYFQVDRGKINGKPGILDQYKAVIIAKPSGNFSEQDKFVLDQYLMRGGKVMWFIDMVDASLDSISEGESMIALINQHNLDDMLFRYGVRINPVLVQDIQCNMIPVNVAFAGVPADFRLAPWLYSPLLSSPNTHPITKNLNMIKTEFAGNIDTIMARKGIKKTVLLRSSEISRQVNAPAIISLDDVRIPLRQEQFTNKYQSIAVLLEGQFETAFKNRGISELFPDTAVKVMESSCQTGILVVADGDIIRNDTRLTPQGILISPLGFDRYTQQTYGNKDFILNVTHYLTGHAELIDLRSRELTLRLLDKSKITKERLKWVLINTLGPPLLVILVGIVFTWFRKKRYSGYLVEFQKK